MSAARARAFVAVAVVVAAVVVLYRQVLPLGDGPHAHLFFDSVDFSHPYVVFISRCIHAGVWPAWNPFEFGGTPFWGNLQGLLFNPPTLLTASLFDVTTLRFQLLQVAQVALGALGMLVWTRARTRSWLAAITVGVLFAASGGVVNLFTHYALLSLYCLLPWPFACFQLWRQSGRERWLLGTSVAIASWLVTSYPSQLGYYCVAFALWVLVVRAPALRVRAERGALGRELLFLGVVAPSLAATHLVPALELMPLLSRGHGLPYEAIRDRIGYPAQLFSIAFGGLATAPNDFASPDVTLRDYFVGLTALFAAFYTLARPTRGKLLVAAAVILSCDAMLRRSIALPILHRLTPMSANSFYPSVEFGTLVCFALLTLAGDGLGELALAPWSWRRVAFALGGVAVVVALFYWLGAPHWIGAQRLDAADWRARTLTPLVIVLAVIAAAWAAAALVPRHGRAVAATLLLVAAVVEAASNVAPNDKILYRPSGPGEFAAEAAVIQAPASSYVDLTRHFWRRATWPAPGHLNLLDGSRVDGGYDASIPSSTLSTLTTPWARRVLLDPRAAFVADALVRATDPAAVPLVDGGKVTAALPTDAAELPDVDGAPRAVIDVTRYSINRIAYRIDVARPALIVFNELALPGWRLRVDDHRRPLLTANGRFRAAVASPGLHGYVLEYVTPGGRAGLAITLAGALLAAAWLARSARARRRRGGLPSEPAKRGA